MVKAPQARPVPGWLAALYPFSPATFVTPGGAAMSYVDEGPRSDEAVLMLHGNPTWSFYYRSLVADLSPSLRCIAPDHIGMGLSEKPAGYDYRLSTRIADIEALVDSLGLRKVHLVVHDWGGAIGFGLAARRPGLIGRIVILNTAAFPSSAIPARIALCRAPYLGALLVRGLNGFADPATWMAMAERRLTWDQRRGYLHPYDSWANRVGVHQFVRDIPLEAGHPSRGTLEAVAAGLPGLAGNEKLIVWGGRDFCFNETFLARWREIYPDAQLHLLGQAGHYVLEDAGPVAVPLISAFLTQNQKT
jgi:pimeloyl-ACP methyl ester carboxylesterase